MSVDLLNGLILHYPCQEGTGTTLVDASSSGLNGTLSNGPTWGTGKFGNGVVLDGVDDVITRAHNAAFNVNNITVCGWFYPTVWSAGTLTTLASKQENSSGFPSWSIIGDFANTTTAIQAGICVGTTNYVAAGPCKLNVNNWYHCGFTYDGETLIAYTQGVPGTPNTSPSGNLTTTTAAIWFGGNATFQAGRYFTGRMMDLRIYNRALNSDEFAALQYHNLGTIIVDD
jgi:hypothetical protein